MKFAGFLTMWVRGEKKDWGEVKRLSLDEFSMHKGHKNFKTVVSNVDTGELLEVIHSHTQQGVTEALMQQAFELPEVVEEVSVDMWGGFPKVVREVFPNAVIVFDRFHVMKMVNDALNKIRKKAGVTVKGSKHLLLKNFEDLTEKQQLELEQVLSLSRCLRIAYELKEQFRQIYETSQTPKSGQKRIEKWLRQAQLLFGEMSQTTREHLEGICNYFISQTTSGVMEGINTRIKLIMRQGYGFANFDNFRARLLACFSDK